MYASSCCSKCLFLPAGSNRGCLATDNCSIYFYEQCKYFDIAHLIHSARYYTDQRSLPLLSAGIVRLLNLWKLYAPAYIQLTRTSCKVLLLEYVDFSCPCVDNSFSPGCIRPSKVPDTFISITSDNNISITGFCRPSAPV